jgi:uncharacterized membrane protein
MHRRQEVMAVVFCANCGSQVEGQFCAKCGAAVGAPATGATQTASGISTNLASALCYLFGFVTGIIFLVLSPYNQDSRVRFHAFQSIFFNISWIVIAVGLGVLSAMFSALNMWVLIVPIHMLIDLALFATWIYLMFKAYSGSRLVLPIIGPIAERQAGAGGAPPEAGNTMGRAA